jgi:peptide/nickel transport system permease protein
VHTTARRRTTGLRTGITILAVLAAIAIAAPWLATDRPWVARGAGGLSFPAWTGSPLMDGDHTVLAAPIRHDPDRIRLDDVLRPPSGRHWLGTDSLGRDVAARLVHGARVSVAIGLLSAIVALAIGIPLGAVAGYARGWTDAIAMRAIEAVLCFPTLLLLLALLAAPPEWLGALHDVVRISIVLGAVGWVPVARYLRGEVLRISNSEAVTAARAIGASPTRILVLHVLPGALAPVLVTAAFAAASAIVVEASLSFLGLGVSAPTSTWGGLLAEARDHVTLAWWMVLYPGLALFATLLGCNLVGEGLRDALDPRERSS